MLKNGNTESTGLAMDIAFIGQGQPETIAMVRMHYRAALDKAKEDMRLIDGAIIDHIEATGQPVPTGPTTELRATYPKDTDCLSNEETTDAVFAAVGGDVKRFAECLSANAFKHGACKRILPTDVYSLLFRTTTRSRLEEKPRKVLAEVDRRFLPLEATR